MKAESIIFSIAGMVFGIILGWILGDQMARREPVIAPPPAQTGSAEQPRQVPPLDEDRVKALTTLAENDKKNVEARLQLATLYSESERYQDAVKWYEDAVAIDPKNVEASTALGVAYYYTNQPDRALEQFERSLKVQPAHPKTLLNQGIVRAFGKQDLDGAAQSWQKIIDQAPDSPEAQAARQGIETIKARHAGAAPAGG
jgi:cytochrome c-type biogenesis protein CcmH